MGRYSVNKTPKESALALATRCKLLRKQIGWSRAELAKRSGVAYETIRKFDREGNITLVSLLKLLDVMGELKNVESLVNLDDKDRVNQLFDI